MTQQQQRHIRILEYLHQNRHAQVTHLAKYLGVSSVTVRKDVTLLEQRKLLLRFQGYIELNTSTAVHRRLLANYARKLSIAKKAAALIADGDTVILESGTCCILLAQELKNEGKTVTILTNSTFLADFISPCRSITLILLGGTYQPDSMATVGPVTRACLTPFYAKYLFSGTDGYTTAHGFGGDNPERIDVLRHMAAHADKTVILTESQKFFASGTMQLFSTNEVDTVVTDEHIDPQTESELLAHDIQILKAHEEV